MINRKAKRIRIVKEFLKYPNRYNGNRLLAFYLINRTFNVVSFNEDNYIIYFGGRYIHIPSICASVIEIRNDDKDNDNDIFIKWYNK